MARREVKWERSSWTEVGKVLEVGLMGSILGPGMRTTLSRMYDVTV